jgi:hypothetical protein
VGSLFDALSVPYDFFHEDVFALGAGVLIIGLLLFRFGLARRRDVRADRSS